MSASATRLARRAAAREKIAPNFSPPASLVYEGSPISYTDQILSTLAEIRTRDDVALRPLKDEDNRNLGTGGFRGLHGMSRRELRTLGLLSETARACDKRIRNRLTLVEWFLADSPDHDAKKSETAEADRIDAFFDRVNENGETFDNLLEEAFGDLVSIDQAALQIAYDTAGQVRAIYSHDVASLVPIYVTSGDAQGLLAGYYSDPVDFGSGQFFWPWEIVFFVAGRLSWSKFPSPDADTLARCYMVEILANQSHLDMLDNGRIPPGILAIFGATKQEEKAFEERWRDRRRERVMRVYPSGADAKAPEFVPIVSTEDKNAKLIETQLWVRRTIQAVKGVPDNELGFSDSVNRSTGDNLSQAFRDNAVKPLLETGRDGLTKMVRNCFGVRLFWKWGTIDSTDAEQQARIDTMHLNSGRETINEQRARVGQEPMAWGDAPFVREFGGGAGLEPIESIAVKADMARDMRAVSELRARVRSGRRR